MNADKELIRERFAAGYKRYDRLALVQQRICDRLAGLLAARCETVADGEIAGENAFRRADAVFGGTASSCEGALPSCRCFEIGVGTGFLTRRLLPLFPGAHWILNDIAPAAGEFTGKYTGGHDVAYLWGDAESVPFPAGLDLIASASTVQWFDDLPAFSARAASALRPGGVLALSTFGGDNFREIRATTGEGLEYYPLPELERMFAGAGFRILHAEEYTESLLFDTPADVLHHIKATGVNSLRKARWGRGQLADFDAAYRARFATAGGCVPLTYHPILLIAARG